MQPYLVRWLREPQNREARAVCGRLVRRGPRAGLPMRLRVHGLQVPAPEGRMTTPLHKPRNASRHGPSDIDLTGGFRLDLKTLALVILLVGSWYTQTSKIDALSARLDLQEKARAEVELARRETEHAKLALAEQQQKVFESALAELKAQLKLTALDVGDLKVIAAKGTPGGS